MNRKTCFTLTLTLGKTALVALSIVGYAALPSSAQEATPTPVKLAIEDAGGTARVDYSGRLRMFSQKIAANACALGARPDDQVYKEMLTDSVTRYRQYLLALQAGDESLGIIGAETRAKTIKQIEGLLAIWEPFGAAAEAIVQGQDVEQNLAYVAENNEVLLQAASDLASAINAEYADPAAMTQANAMVIDIAGRQRMLTQKMSKEVCGIETANPVFGTSETLLQTVSLFDASFTALLNGMPEAGIMPPPTPELAADLQAAMKEWQGIKADVEAFAATGPAGDGAGTDLYGRFETLRESMQKIAEQYREFAAAGL